MRKVGAPLLVCRFLLKRFGVEVVGQSGCMLASRDAAASVLKGQVCPVG